LKDPAGKGGAGWARGALARPFYGWWVVLAGSLSHGTIASSFTFTFGQYLRQLQSGLGWSVAAISAVFSISQLVQGLISPVQGALIDRYGPRTVSRAGFVLLSASFLLLSATHHFWVFIVAVMGLSIGAGLSSFLTVNTAIARWFRRRRALAMGIGSVGQGVGGAIAPIVAWSIVTHGWRPTAFGTGLAVLLIGVPLAQLLRGRPEDYGMRPDGDAAPVEGQAPKPGTVDTDHDFTVREALSDRSFWLVSIGHALALVSVFAVMVHIVNHLSGSLGWKETTAQGLFSVVTLTSILGQVGGGWLGDRFSKTRLAAFCMVGHGSAMLIFAFAESTPLIVGAAMVHGLAWGVRGPLMMAIRADFYGRRSFGTIMGYSNIIVMLGPLAGPAIAGALYDVQGDYRMAFLVVAGIAAAGTAAFVLSRKPPLPTRLREGAP
jgi:MFS family permease